MLNLTIPTPFAWFWIVPAGLLAAGLIASAEPAVAGAIGLAAALSLSGSI